MARRKPTPAATAIANAIPREDVETLARELGVVQRARKVDVYSLVLTLCLGFQTGARRAIASLQRLYEGVTGSEIVRSSFYDRLTTDLAELLRKLSLSALARSSAGWSLASGYLAGFEEVLAIDSTVLRLHDLLEDAFPACRTNHTKGAAKLHMVMNVMSGGPTKVKLTGERTADVVPWRRVGKWVKGRLLLFDLGYYSFHLFYRINANGGFFVSRVKTSSNPLIVAVNRKWRGRSVDVVGRRLRDVLPLLHRDVLDVMVEVTFKKRKYRGKQREIRRPLRLVALRNADTGDYHCFFTNLAADRLPAENVGETYALRWQVELLFKSMRSYGHLHQLPSAKRHVVECLIWASVLATIASQALYRAVREVVAKRRHMPLLRWGGIFAEVAESLLQLLVSPNPAADAGLFRRLTRAAPDPNVNRRRRSLPVAPELAVP